MIIAFLIIVAISLILQVAAACLGVRLIRVTGRSAAWLAIAVAMIAMAIRCATLLVAAVRTPETVDQGQFWSEVVGLIIAVLLLAGIATIEPVFRSVQNAREEIERLHGQLAKEIAKQTAELVAANKQLRLEVARRTEAEAALRDEHRHLNSVLAVYEGDRKLIAYEMHDGFVQTATAALMSLQSALAAFPKDPEKAQQRASSALQNLQQSLAQVRQLIRGLRPAVLEDSGLTAAVEQLIHDTEGDCPVHIEWSSQVEFGRLSPVLEMSVFRVIQEGLTNAIRHSKSDRIAITMTQLQETILLRIEDWGCGFDPAKPKRGHYGLEGIRERARLFGGTARIESAPGKGTRIEVDLPVIERD
jgi:signal transduction histidine kinase